MEVIVYNQKGEEVGQVKLPKEIFGLKINPDLIHQIVVSQAANSRKAIANTKDRGEVRGGGKKPWRQKGTGRARHGSIRSPIWKGGGVTFGPTKDRVFKRKINKKMRRLSLFMVLSGKARDKLLLLVDGLRIEDAKTKVMAEFLNRMPCQGKSCLISLPKIDKNIILSARNLPGVKVIEARNLNSLDVLSFKYLIIPKEAIEVISETFLKKQWRF